MGLLSIFHKKEPKLIQIEFSDLKIDKQIEDLLEKTSKVLFELNETVKKADISDLSSKLAEFENIFTRIKSKVDSLLVDVESIIGIESQNKNFILLNDGEYLENKKEKLELMSSTLDELIELMLQHPGIWELKHDILGFIYGKLSVLKDSLASIRNDDEHMLTVYKQIEAF